MGEAMTELDFSLPTKDVTRGFEICLLTPEKVDEYWSSIEGMMKHVPQSLGDWTPDSLYRRAMDGGVQVWAVGDHEKILMIMLTQVAVFPQRRVLEVFWCAGEGIFGPAQELIDATIDLFAKHHNCGRIDVIGREGWGKFVVKHGYKKHATIWSRNVLHEGMQ